jgi:hypothetical protein
LLQVSAFLYASKQPPTPAESGWLGYALGYECSRCRPVTGADRGTGRPGRAAAQIQSQYRAPRFLQLRVVFEPTANRRELAVNSTSTGSAPKKSRSSPMSTSAITPQITRPPLTAAEHLLPRDNGYGIHEVAAVTLGEFQGPRMAPRPPRRRRHPLRIRRHDRRVGRRQQQRRGRRPQRLRQLASVAWATADELGEAQARQRHPAGSGRTA